MFALFTTPGWFNGVDLVFDAVALLIALLIAGYSYRVYSISSENKFKYFSVAFILISIAFLFKLITFGTLYFHPVRETAFQMLMPVTQARVPIMDLFYRAGFFIEMASFLAAFLLIFLISQKSRARLHKYHEVTQISLFIYLVGLIAVIATFKYFVFPLTMAVLVSLIVLNYYKNYLNSDKNSNSYLVVIAFLSILISQLFFIFVFATNAVYFFGEAFLLIGFLLILYVYRRVTNKK